jgi:hypothetical protein
VKLTAEEFDASDFAGLKKELTTHACTTGFARAFLKRNVAVSYWFSSSDGKHNREIEVRPVDCTKSKSLVYRP